MRGYLLLVVALPFAACAAPHTSIDRVVFDPSATERIAAPMPNPQDVVEERADRPKSYLTIGGGLNQQSTTSGSTPDSDTDAFNVRIGGGYRPNHYIDIGLNNDIFLTSTSTAGTRTKTSANSIGATCNFIFNPNSETEFYGGPNLGVYMAKVSGAGFSSSSTEPAYGFQLGMRHWLSAGSALKVEWRNVWSQQEFAGVSSDVHQGTVFVSFDVWF